MARPIWKGHISFGLVNVPVTLFGAENRTDISFHLLDSRDTARVHYQRVNEATGEEVPWDKIVKGFEHSDGNYVLFEEDDLEKVQPELTKTIEIEQFVELSSIDVTYFEKPYYLVPAKGGEKGYVLLREAMKATERVGIARVVVRSRGHLAALMPQGDTLLLELLRFHQELRSADDFAVPAGNKGKHRVAPKEIKLATSLVEGMAGEWNPTDYKDEYREALRELIKRRVKAGQTEAPPDEEEEAEEQPATVNFLDVLRQSVEGRSSPKKKPKAKRSARKTKGRRKKAS